MKKRGISHMSCKNKPLNRNVSKDEITPFSFLETGLLMYLDKKYPTNGFQFLQNNLKDVDRNDFFIDDWSCPKASDVPTIPLI